MIGDAGAAIVTAGLSKSYRSGRWLGSIGSSAEIQALRQLSIEVERGEIFGFLGPNGAGKSTAIRLLLGFLHPTAGRAAVLGFDVVKETIEVRRRCGYLPGGIALYDTMTGDELLRYLGELHGDPRPRRRASLVDRLELSASILRRPVRDYSRGMRQKIGIVQALQHDPELAILDEPTEGLDPLMQRAFYELLDELRAQGRTIFFSSHVISEVERICDRVAIVRDGQLVALEDVGSLLAQRRRQVELQFQGDPPNLDDVVGVSEVRRNGDRLTCRLEGEVAPFLEALRGASVVDLTIEPAHLEDAFFEYYGSGATGSSQATAARASAMAPDATGSD